MREIGVLEVKTHLSALLEKVEEGEDFVITRNGKAIARVTSVKERRRASPAAIAASIALQKAIEEKYGLDDGFDWKAAVNEGRP